MTPDNSDGCHYDQEGVDKLNPYEGQDDDDDDDDDDDENCIVQPLLSEVDACCIKWAACQTLQVRTN